MSDATAISGATGSGAGSAGTVVGMLAEFSSEEALMVAAEQVRDQGFRRWDCHTPYPVHGLDKAMGIRQTILPWFVFCGGVTGALIGLLMQWWMNAYDYPFIISGKPFFSLPASVPVIFELTILLSAFGAVFGMFALNGLPRFYHPVFLSERFKRSTDDRYFISVEAGDSLFSASETRAFLESLQPNHVEVLEE